MTTGIRLFSSYLTSNSRKTALMFLKYFTQQYGKESVSLAETLEEKYAKI